MMFSQTTVTKAMIHAYKETRMDKGQVAVCGESGYKATMVSDILKVTCSNCLDILAAPVARKIEEINEARSARNEARGKTTRYNIRSVQTMIEQLDAWIDQTEESLDNAESADYPNETRIESLQARLDSLTEAKEALEAIE